MMNFCKKCSISLLERWQGWPLRDSVPCLPQVIDKICTSCGDQGEVINSSDIQWLNYHGPYNSGLPDYWLLVTDQKTIWGLPYFSEGACERCGKKAVISEYGDGRKNNRKYKMICCG